MDLTTDASRILLLDGDPKILTALRRRIESLCCDVTIISASDMPTAEWQLHNTPVNLVLASARVGTHEDAGARLAEEARKTGVPVVLLTLRATRGPLPSTRGKLSRAAMLRAAFGRRWLADLLARFGFVRRASIARASVRSTRLSKNGRTSWAFASHD